MTMVEHDLKERIGALEAENARLRRLLDQAGMPSELRHQVRNALGVMRAVIRGSARRRAEVEDYAAYLESRFDALLRVQHLILHGAPKGVSLALLIADELQAHLIQEGRTADVQGTPILLQSKAAETFALVIHELVVNGLEHGRLGHPEGRLTVRWGVEQGEAQTWLRFAWIEHGSPATEADFANEGFGTDVLERGLAYDLKAVVQRSIRDDDLRYELRLPLTHAVGHAVPAERDHEAVEG